MAYIRISLFLLLTLPGIALSDGNTIKIATPIWQGYTNEDGTGFYHTLFRAIFDPKKYNLEFTYALFNRSQKLLIDGEVDAVPAAYADESRNTIYPKWHMGTDFINALYLKTTIQEWQGEQSLTGKTVGWVRGYNFDEYGIVKSRVNKHILRTVESGIKMLERGRIDVLLDYESEITPVVEELGIDTRVFNQENTIPGLKLYMEFSNTKRGKILATIYDRGMERLFQSGKLQNWFLQYDGVEYIRPE